MATRCINLIVIRIFFPYQTIFYYYINHRLKLTPVSEEWTAKTTVMRAFRRLWRRSSNYYTNKHDKRLQCTQFWKKEPLKQLLCSLLSWRHSRITIPTKDLRRRRFFVNFKALKRINDVAKVLFISSSLFTEKVFRSLYYQGLSRSTSSWSWSRDIRWKKGNRTSKCEK